MTFEEAKKKRRMFSGCFSTHRSKKMIWPCVHVEMLHVMTLQWSVFRGRSWLKCIFHESTPRYILIFCMQAKNMSKVGWYVLTENQTGKVSHIFFFCLNVNDSDNDFTCLGTNALVGSSNWSFWWRAPPLFNVIWPLISTTQWGCSVCQRVAF